MKKRLIHKKSLRLSQEEYTRYSYESVFNPGYHKTSEIADEQIQTIIKEKEQEWQLRLTAETGRAHEDGYKKGLEEGKQQALREIHTHLAPLTKALREASERMETFFEDLKPPMQTLIFELAEKAVQIPLTGNEQLTQYVSEQLTEFLQHVKAESEIRIRVSGADYEPVAAEVLQDGEYKNVHIGTDETLNPGEYEMETDYEAVVNRFPLLIQQFRKSLNQ